MKRTTVIQCAKVKADERRRQVVFSLSHASSQRSLTRVAPTRPKLLHRHAPEERRRSMSSIVLTPAGLVRMVSARPLSIGSTASLSRAISSSRTWRRALSVSVAGPSESARSNGGRDPAKLAQLAQGRLKASCSQLVAALDGQLSENQPWLLQRLLAQLGSLEQEIVIYSEQIQAQMLPYQVQLERLDRIGGVGRRSAENLLAEIGPEMAQFPTSDHLVSWGALSPGKDKSVGQQRSSRTLKGNRWLKRALTAAAWAATHEKESYLAALYRRLAPRRGKKRAIIAVARTILQAAWHILKEEVEDKALGGDDFDRWNEEKTTGYLIKRLEKFGYEVILKSKQAPV